jgi:oligoribonuclease NrnB/cAMP/cGMP phosphodiesterase (DHH superfamily)
MTHPKNVVFSHRGCRDGFCAAAIAYRKFKITNELKFTSFIFIEPCDDDEIRKAISKLNSHNLNIYFYDVACSPSYFEELSEQKNVNTIQIFDHHISTQNAYLDHFGKIPFNITFDNERCGAVLCWLYNFGNVPIPKTVLYIEDRDLWNNNLKDGDAFIQGFSLKNDFEIWNTYFDEENTKIPQTIERGKTLLFQKKGIMRNIMQLGKIVKLDGYRVYVLNNTIFVSDIGNEACQQKDENGNYLCDYALIWRRDETNQQYYCSLRSRKNSVDVSKIAKQFNDSGGGHAAAAGFNCSDINQTIFSRIKTLN